MADERLKGLQLQIESKSFADAMYAVLAHCGWWTRSKPVLAGMTVTAFRFTVDRRLTRESCTAYNWIAENFLAADFIGVTTSQQAGFTFDRTFPLYRDHAIAEIKRSIDRGIGAVIWHDGFVAVTGYSDARRTLLLDDGSSEDGAELPYEQFGMEGSPYWYYQAYEKRMELDPIEIMKESLIQAVYKWETHDPMLPAGEYGCGRAAYEMLLSAFRSGDYCTDGAAAVIDVYAAHKRDIEHYLSAVRAEWPDAEPVQVQYARVSAVFSRLNRYMMNARDERPDPERGAAPHGECPLICDMIREAMECEEAAIRAIKSLLRETIYNRFHDIALR